MCGIAGYISIKRPIARDSFLGAVSVLQHRGPDAGGYYFSPEGNVALGHRRLSVIDLTTAANQPMFSADGRYCMVYNGELYNFRELKRLLAAKGNELHTGSDTEVLLELFAQQGPSCFSLLNGMFAFAIFDTVENKLTLCRDHAGIKPLFFYQDEEKIVFGSELKFIRACLGDQLKTNVSAVPYFLHLGYIPQPATIYERTYKFPSAHYVQIDTTGPVLHEIFSSLVPFWKLEEQVSRETLRNEEAAKKQLNELLQDAVEKQLVSDVPVGTFLSGGVDSSLVTALAARALPGQKVRTFSIAIDDGKFNESAFARRVAAALRTEHHEFPVKEKEALELISSFLPTYDEPFADSSALPTMLVSHLARQHVTVTLSGDGGDELFYGYGMYTWAQRLAHPLIPFTRGGIYLASRVMPYKYQRAGTMFAYSSRHNLPSHIFSQEQYFFREQELRSLLSHPDFHFEGLNEMPPFARPLSATEKQAFWDFGHYLKDDLLVKVDRASMRYSLENRVPLLDHRIVEFAYNLNCDLKIKGPVQKYLLKEVLYDYLPREIFQRPKWGFSIPLAKWMQADLRYLAEQYTSRAVIEKYGLLEYREVARLKKEFYAGKNYLYNRIWVILILHWWLEENAAVIPGK